MAQIGSNRADSDKLFDFTEAQMRKGFKDAVEHLGLTQWFDTLYQRRRESASKDLVTYRRSRFDVKARGRWATDASSLRYMKRGSLQQAGQRMPVHVRQLSEAVLPRLRVVRVSLMLHAY